MKPNYPMRMKENPSEKLIIQYRSNRKSLRSIFNQVPANTAILIQSGGAVDSEKINDLLKKDVEDAPKEGIEISPKIMTFKNPSEGYHCRKRLIIKNTGLKVAHIQIHQPTSLAYNIETLETRTILHPGLSLQIWITYSFRRPSLLKAYLPIKINEDLINYQLLSVISSAHIIVEPNFIDFDKVDFNCESKSKTVTIKNDGDKSTRFTIDVARQDLDIIVLPEEGFIKARSEIKLKVKVVGLKEGTFYSEFWIKSCQNIPVSLKATTIIPKFQVGHPNSIENFVLIDFPETFVDNLNYETFIVRNLSTRNVNFLVLAEINEELLNISEIDESKYPVYSVFKICPIEGAMKPFESKIFNVTFFPTSGKVNPFKEAKDFLTFFKIIRFYVSEVKGNVGIMRSTSEEHLKESLSQRTLMESNSENSKLKNEADLDSITLCVHGKVERAELIFTPDKLYFGDVKVGEKVTRKVLISNPSVANTLIFQFVINPNARCIPKEGFIKPKKSLHVLIEVKGKIELQATFILKFDASAKTFNECPFPKKQSRKVRSYKIKCYLNLLLESKNESKVKLIRRFDSISENEICNAIKLPKVKSDFSLIKPPGEIMSKLKTDIKSLKSSLSSLELYNIKITPAVLDFGKIVSHNIGYKKIQFENRNNFPIMIRLISPLSNYIIFPDNDEIILEAKAKNFKFVGFSANNENTINGYFNYIINDNHSFEMKIMSEIVDKYLKINKKEIVLGKEYLNEALREDFTYVEVENKLNTDIGFEWKMDPEAAFKIEPLSGLVRANKKIFMHISYDIDHSKSNQTKLMMINDNISNDFLKLKMHLLPPKVNLLENYIDFGKIPLNMPVENFAILYNSEFSSTTFQVDLDFLTKEIDVYPLQGIIPPRGFQILKITLNFQACVEFTKYISVTVQKSVKLKVKIIGQVQFPILKLNPEQIKIKQVNFDSQKGHLISAINQGETQVKLQFLLNKYPEFTISIFPDGKDFLQDEDKIIINAASTQNFYLRFNPTNPVSYNFILPILMNEIIGPCSLEDPKTLKPVEYLKSKEYENSKTNGISITKLPTKLENICINCSAPNQIISFNNLNFHFDTSLDLIEDEFSLLNQSNEETTIIIKTDIFQEKNCSFGICWSSKKEPKINPFFIICNLLPKEETTFKINFQPFTEGHFELEVPIYLKKQIVENMKNKIEEKMKNKVEEKIRNKSEESMTNINGKGITDKNTENMQNELEECSQNKTEIYSILKMEGDNPESSIESKIQEIYFNPLQLNTKSVKSFNLIIKNFKYDGIMMFKVLNPERKIGLFTNETIKVKFPEGNAILKSQKKEIKVSIQLSNPEPVSFCTKVEFFDHKKTCFLLITIYGNIDNSILTTYSYEFQKYDNFLRTKTKNYANLTATNNFCNEINNRLFKKLNELTTDSSTNFPNEIKNRNYETFLRETLISAEEWLFSEIGFEFYPNIINGITAVVSDIFKKPENVKLQNNNKKNINYSIFTILEIIIGSSFKSFINMPDSLPENISHERITLLLEKYSKILEFLCKSGAFLVHVSPKFLLIYNDYLKLEEFEKCQTFKLENNIKTTMSKENFESHSIQNWLDIILQIYKCFRLVRVKNQNLAQKIKNPENRDFCEKILLAWLQYHYEQQSNEKWLQSCNENLNPDDEEDKLQTKLINNFDDCLADGLIFIAVTGAYCPFLIKEFFKNIYICPRRPEEALHNAICVVAAWKKIRLGFLVKPTQIIRPNCVHMLMLVTHLHTLLETYLIKAKVQFSCPLTKSITKEITVTNPTDNTVNFVTQFFENELEFFSIISAQKVLKLNPRQSKKISITFDARIFQETRAYLIICGHSVGPHFAPNQTFLLEGSSSELTIVDEQIIISKLYEILNTLIPIKVPYKNEAIYNIAITDEQPKDFSILKVPFWFEIYKKKIPRRIFLNQKSLIVTENAFSANLSITIGSKTPQSKSYWLIFQSENCDFIIKIVSTCRSPIFQPIPVFWTLDFCTCPKPPNEINKNCPLNIKLKIPSRNSQLWKCTKQMLKKAVNSKEWCFWSRVLDTSFGAKIIQWNLGDQEDSLSSEISHLFESRVDFNISISEEFKYLSAADKLSVSDVHAPEAETEINLHISQSTPEIYEAILKLKSLNGKEIRNYKVKFLCQT